MTDTYDCAASAALSVIVPSASRASTLHLLLTVLLRHDALRLPGSEVAH